LFLRGTGSRSLIFNRSTGMMPPVRLIMIMTIIITTLPP